MATGQKVVCKGYWQENLPECEGWCEVCGVCYDEGYCTPEHHYDDCSICHKSHKTDEHSKVMLAIRMQDIALMKTVYANAANICEVCNGEHKTWKCCAKCNSDEHMCKLCGDPLGHEEISACYILDMLEIL